MLRRIWSVSINSSHNSPRVCSRIKASLIIGNWSLVLVWCLPAPAIIIGGPGGFGTWNLHSRAFAARMKPGPWPPTGRDTSLPLYRGSCGLPILAIAPAGSVLIWRVTRSGDPHPPGADDADSAARRGRMQSRSGRTHQMRTAPPCGLSSIERIWYGTRGTPEGTPSWHWGVVGCASRDRKDHRPWRRAHARN
jgi:hypothetical protein